MNEPEVPKIEFPCDYPIKVLGRTSAEFETLIFEVFERHAPGFDRASVVSRSSRNGTFTAITVTITATGKPQLEAIHVDLMATNLVNMVL